MANNFQIPPGEVEHRNAFRDSRGIQALAIGAREVVTVDPDGHAKVFKDNEHVQLGCGRVINAWMLGKLELAICDLCRYPPAPPWWRAPDPPTLGVMLRESGEFCVGCSRFTCRRHSRVGSDGAVRCIPCARRFRRWAFIHALFFAPVYEDEE